MQCALDHNREIKMGNNKNNTNNYIVFSFLNPIDTIIAGHNYLKKILV